MRLESIRLKNFKAFKDVTFDRLPEFCVFVGANGTGKSTVFSVFEFLKNALTYDLGEAFSRLGGWRGFDDVRSRDSEGPIEIELTFRRDAATSITYFLALDKIEGKPFVFYESMSVLDFHAIGPSSSLILDFRLGFGRAVITTFPDKKSHVEPVAIKLKSMDTLALKVFMLQEDYTFAVELGEFLKNHHIFDFHAQKARSEQEAKFVEHLSRDGDNLASVAEHLYTRYPEVFRKILEKLKCHVPGIGNVEAKMEGRRVLLRFQDGAFKDPFDVQNVSDGTIKMFAYLVLLHDPAPYPLLCIEEPENQLYHILLEELGEEFRYYAHRGNGQVMVSTHSPDFLNACNLDEVFWLEKKNGYTQVFRAADDPQIAAYMNDGGKMGYLWSEGFFGKVHPR